MKKLIQFPLLFAALSLAAPLAAWSVPTKGNAVLEAAITKNFDAKDVKWGPAPEFMPKGTKLSVLHGDPSKKDADAFLHIPAKATIPMHWHTSDERMVLVSGMLRVTYEGQEPALMKAGTYGFGPAKLKHEATCESSTPCVLFIAFEEPVDAVPVTN